VPIAGDGPGPEGRESSTHQEITTVGIDSHLEQESILAPDFATMSGIEAIASILVSRLGVLFPST
jgi:hypothetical protein